MAVHVQQKNKAAAQQGDLNGACGFYAIVNAIHLLEPELTPEEIFRLVFMELLEGDPKRFIDGTYRGSIKNSLGRVLDELHNIYNFTLNDRPCSIKFAIPYWAKYKPRNRNDVLDILGAADYKRGNVIIIGYTHDDGHNKYAHWSVIKLCKGGYLHTHDSSKESKKISLDQIRVDAIHKKHASRPYNIISGDIFQIWLHQE